MRIPSRHVPGLIFSTCPFVNPGFVRVKTHQVYKLELPKMHKKMIKIFVYWPV